MRTALLTSILMLPAGAAAAQNIEIANARVIEGHNGSRTVDVKVFLSAPASGPITLTYTTRNGTAVADDYSAANGTVAFSKGEIVKIVTVMVTGETLIEEDETFDVVLSQASGAAVADGIATVTIVNDDFPASGSSRSSGPSRSSGASGAAGASVSSASGSSGAAGGPSLSVYEVRFTFRGFTGSMEAAPDCPVRRDGTVVMTGLVAGFEGVPRDEDITYRGVLQFDANLDLCDAKEARPGEHELCSIGVAGSGPMQVELEAYGDARGGYVKVEKVPGAAFKSTLWGSCDGTLIAEERKMFPDDSQATMFNGLDLNLKGPLRVGTYLPQTVPGPPGQNVAQHNVMLEVLRVVRP